MGCGDRRVRIDRGGPRRQGMGAGHGRRRRAIRGDRCGGRHAGAVGRRHRCGRRGGAEQGARRAGGRAGHGQRCVCQRLRYSRGPGAQARAPGQAARAARGAGRPRRRGRAHLARGGAHARLARAAGHPAALHPRLEHQRTLLSHRAGRAQGRRRGARAGGHHDGAWRARPTGWHCGVHGAAPAAHGAARAALTPRGLHAAAARPGGRRRAARRGGRRGRRRRRCGRL
mmetsp:Transcript_16539/g.51428  ORF Transcript_16539/g.51428 Transcript_16539/m.51428 type:complete len:228 (+) Transcript_16539:245-928(+)